MDGSAPPAPSMSRRHARLAGARCHDNPCLMALLPHRERLQGLRNAATCTRTRVPRLFHVLLRLQPVRLCPNGSFEDSGVRTITSFTLKTSVHHHRQMTMTPTQGQASSTRHVKGSTPEEPCGESIHMILHGSRTCTTPHSNRSPRGVGYPLPLGLTRFPHLPCGRVARKAQANLAVSHHSSTRATDHHVPGTPSPLPEWDTRSGSGSLGYVPLMGCASPPPHARSDGEVIMVPMSLAHVSWSHSPA